MIQLSEEYLVILNLLIKRNIPFVIYKMPHENGWHFRMQTKGKVSEYSDLSELNDKKGYVIAPFRISEDCPILLLNPDKRELPSIDEVKQLNSPISTSKLREESSSEVLFENYKQNFETFINPLREGKLEKLVLSRQQIQKIQGNMSLAEAFLKACNTYPNAYVYLLNTDVTGVWMGSTPERLLSGNESEWETVALAGTQINHGNDAVAWDAKNLHEQDLVVQYIKEQLSKFGVTAEVTGPTNIYAGQVVHLISHFKFTLSQRNKLGDLLKLLHPTPAVCGTPKHLAFEFIKDHEQESRKYYSGFIGDLDPNGKTELFVNLRCMQIQQKTCTLYAGGGLLASSTLEDEWNETENKMLTMKALLQDKTSN